MIVRILLLLAVGAVVGSILGSIVTGDWIYTIVWAVGLPVALTVAGILGSRRRKLPLTTPARIPGIIGSARTQPVPTHAVLNPEPTATPATGATLNGEPLDPAVLAKMPEPRPRGGVPWWSRVLAVALILMGVALVLIPSYRTIGWTVGNLAQGRWDGNDMRSGLHQQEAIDDLAAVIGSYDFVAVNFYDSYVLVEAPTFAGATTTDQYEWRYGRAARLGPYSGAVSGLFDASEIDFSIVADLVARAKADAGWPEVTAFYPSVRHGDGDEPEITISLSNDYYSASYTYTIRGDLISKYGTGVD
jgi:MFS family permease